MDVVWLLLILGILAVFYRSRKEIYIVPESNAGTIGKIKPNMVFNGSGIDAILRSIRTKTPSKIAVISNGNAPALAQALHYGTGGLYKIKVIAS